MIRINCETFDWGWHVIITRVTGLKETPLYIRHCHNMQEASTPAQAIQLAMAEAYDCLRYDLPETPEHS